MKKIVIFASGSGSNAQRIIEFALNEPNSNFRVEAIFCNNPNAFVIHRAKKFNVPCYLFDRAQFNSMNQNSVLSKLQEINPSLIVLAGFLWLIPDFIVKSFPNKIINIHPALLPKYGGKGMYGERVHQAVIEHQETESGITIHYVSEYYDEGNIIAQYKCSVAANDSADSLAQKIHTLEHQWFPVEINDLCKNIEVI
ncbi:MAG: phosphoribosylglycinamide formyltransferase [Bacteroidota bacterium]